jgi:rSAM/selenodomain-associated transferase 1
MAPHGLNELLRVPLALEGREPPMIDPWPSVDGRRLMIFTKPPVPGRVKTRLIGVFTAEQAAEFQKAALADLVQELGDRNFDLRLCWALEAKERMPRSTVRGEIQVGADLGERIYRALQAALRQCPVAAVIGSDHPEIDAERVEQAFALLEDGTQVVIGPSADGGYYLLGLRREALSPMLFVNLPWSTPAVCTTTIERCRKVGLSFELLPTGFDIDTPIDVLALAQRLVKMPPARCRRTRRLLKTWGRLPEA